TATMKGGGRFADGVRPCRRGHDECQQQAGKQPASHAEGKGDQDLQQAASQDRHSWHLPGVDSWSDETVSKIPCRIKHPDMILRSWGVPQARFCEAVWPARFG